MDSSEFLSPVLGSHLVPRSPPLCPELRLWLLGDEVNLEARVSELLSIETAPYWAFCWGAGQALARYVLDHPELVRGRSVADLGAGSGVAALAALKAGAARATAVDIDPFALRACRENAALNELVLETQRELPEAFDVLLASDVLYEVGNRDLIQQQVARGRRVLVGDPLRQGNPRLEREPVARYDVFTLPNVDPPCNSAVVYLF